MNNTPLKLHVFDVGHGDSLLLEFPDGKSYGIIDCHHHRKSHRGFGQEYDSDEPKMLTYFRKLVEDGVEPVVEFVCLTHPHLDHYRGYARLLRGLMDLNIPILAYWDFGPSSRVARAILKLPEEPEFEEIKNEIVSLTLVKEELLKVVDYKILVNPNHCIWSSNGIEIDLLAPDAKQFWAYVNYLECDTDQERQKYRNYFLKRKCLNDQEKVYGCKCPTDDHNISSALLVRYGNAQIVLSGDISDCAWRGILLRRNKIDPSCHCMKVSHHGSIRGNKPYDNLNLWEILKHPEGKLVAVISGGYRFGLPHEETISDLELADCDIYCTGPRVPITHKPYIVENIDDQLASFCMEAICFVDPEDDTATDDPTETGDGNIVIECFSDGTCEAHTEFERCASPPNS